METREETLRRRSLAPTAKIRLHDDHDAIDRAYWRSIAPDERAAMCWTLFVSECSLMGIHADQLRLDRSVARIQRRGR